MRNKNAKIPDISKMYTDPGTPEVIVYAPQVSEDGVISLVESGRENIQDFIDSFAETTDMSFIIKQLQLGNNSVLAQRDVFYGDFTEMPKSPAEVIQIRINAEKAWNRLPLAIRQSFNNSFEEWFSTNGKPEWCEKMKVLIPEKESSEEVIADAP